MFGRKLLIDLGTGTISEERFKEQELVDFVGGRGLGVKILSDTTDPSINPLNPNNPLIITVGPLTGIAPLSGRHSIVAKSPLTGTIFDSSGGGHFGRALRYAEIGVLIITGASVDPVYIAIDDESVEIKDASHLWGLNVRKTTDELKKSGRVACIGRGGERLVRISSIMNDYVHTCGRGGLGAVMGSKHLKAITVRGTTKPSPADPEGFEIAKAEAMRLLRASPVLKGLNTYGTSVLVNLMNYMQIMPTGNFNQTYFEEAEHLSGEEIRERYDLKNHACANCFVACKHSDGETGLEIPEYETIWAFGPDNNNSDIGTIIEANHECNDYGIDTISTGSTIACHSEIIGEKIPAEEIPEIVKSIGEKNGIGAKLSDGSRIYAASHNQPNLSMTAKGLEFPGYDPRGVLGQALGYATSNRGGCHLRAYMVSPEIIGKPKLIDRTTLRGKAGLINIFQNFSAATDTLILCRFTSFALSEEECASLLSAATGHNYTSEEFLLTGERIWNMERLYNLKAGITERDDTLPKRFFKNEKGIKHEEFLKTIQEYYHYRGWNNQGIPRIEKLEELKIPPIYR
ncbi:aldehyde ferredoxin oxidoreductase [Methanosarcinales archaeon]|nr:MAG: aldehyde ferredoxin oxidoreductase [Methanosarcinales archaeon]